MIFCLIDKQFDLKITLRLLNQVIKYINENPQNVFIFKIVFSINRNHLCYPIKEKTFRL